MEGRRKWVLAWAGGPALLTSMGLSGLPMECVDLGLMLIPASLRFREAWPPRVLGLVAQQSCPQAVARGVWSLGGRWAGMGAQGQDLGLYLSLP